jgi:phosphoribosylformylglycinamidine (FGAM) synthase PurS component
MTKINLYVGLKIPDKTAITSFHTLEKMGFNRLKRLEREDYYEFDVYENEDSFMKNIVKVDILVNANKNYAMVSKGDEKKQIKSDNIIITVLVKDSGDKCEGILSTLKERMGFSNINSMSKSVLWRMHINSEDEDEARKIGENITKELLYNEHYQEYKFV